MNTNRGNPSRASGAISAESPRRETVTAQGASEDEIRSLADRLYSGSSQNAFRHWALTCLVADQEATEDMLQDHVDLDGSGDLGIDGYWVDDTNARLLLMQAKHSSTSASRVGARVVQELRAATQNLLDETYVRRHANRRMREAYPDIQEAILDDTYTLWLVLATNRRVSRSAYDYSSGQGAAPWLFEHSGSHHRKDVVVDVFTSDELKLYGDQLMAASVPTPEVTLLVPGGMYHEVRGEFRGCQAIVLARDIADAYRVNRGAIFRLNVRGPLGSNKVNREIVKSLEEPIYRKNFHLLNNGLSILCDAFEYNADSGALTARNFQVVNGCQTTYTLYDYRDVLDDSVWVRVTVIEGANWAPMIAKSTNTQSTVKAEDFRTLEEVHDALRAKFQSLEPPWLYEVKRGEGRFATATDQRRQQTRFGERRLTMREVAKSALAFLGRPVMAKFDLGVLFDLQNDEGVELYGRIFNPALSAEQLLLPALIARRVRNKVNSLSRDAEHAVSPDTPSDVDWLPYARMHVIGLIAEWLRLQKPEESASDAFLSPGTSRGLIATIGDWFDQAFNVAVETVRYRMDVFRDSTGPLTNLREYFRSNENYRKMVQRLRRSN